jgi:hypothetical protein
MPTMTKTLTIELDRGHGWQRRAEGKIPADTSTARIEADLRAYAIQYPHRALLDGRVVATATCTASIPQMHTSL